MLSSCQSIEIDKNLFNESKSFKNIYIQDYPNEKISYEGIFLKDIIVNNCFSLKIVSSDSFVIELEKEELDRCELKEACPVIFYDRYSKWPKKSKYGGYVGPFYLVG